MKGIAHRFERIMDKYLIPAGFEIQKAQQEYERLLQGKELFDKNIANLLDNAQNNNERYEILSGLKDYAIPNYDDLPAAYEALRGPLLRTVEAARGAELVPIETTFGNMNMEGFEASEFAAALAELIKAGGDTEADFALAILRNYRGETSTHVALKEIVSRFPDDVSKMSRVRIVIDGTGVVSGELGFAKAWQFKKESLTEWLADKRPTVKAFAEKHISELALRIASEQRRAEAEREMRNRSYDEEDDESDHSDGDGSESAG